MFDDYCIYIPTGCSKIEDGRKIKEFTAGCSGRKYDDDAPFVAIGICPECEKEILFEKEHKGTTLL